MAEMCGGNLLFATVALGATDDGPLPLAFLGWMIGRGHFLFAEDSKDEVRRFQRLLFADFAALHFAGSQPLQATQEDYSGSGQTRLFLGTDLVMKLAWVRGDYDYSLWECF
jgi:hypothetical protein